MLVQLTRLVSLVRMRYLVSTCQNHAFQISYSLRMFLSIIKFLLIYWVLENVCFIVNIYIN